MDFEALLWLGHHYLLDLGHPRSLMWLGHHHLCNLRHLCGWSIIICGAQELRWQMWLGHYHSWNLKHWCHWAINMNIYATEDHANVVGPSVCREPKALCWRGHLYLRILRRLCGLAITIYGTGDTAVAGPLSLFNLRHRCGWAIVIYGT